MKINTKPVEVTMCEFSLTEEQVEYLLAAVDYSRPPFNGPVTIWRNHGQKPLDRKAIEEFTYGFRDDLTEALSAIDTEREKKVKADKAAKREKKAAAKPAKQPVSYSPVAATAKAKKPNGTWTCPGCGRAIGSMGKGRHTSTCTKYIAQAKQATAAVAVHGQPGQLDDEVEAPGYQERF